MSSSEETPPTGQSLTQRLTGSLGKHVIDRARRAIVHVGGVTVPELLDKSQAAKDRREARSLIISKVAEAAAEKAAQDPELAAGMLDTFFVRENARQENREHVAQQAIEFLEEAATDTVAESDVEGDMDEDWLNVFGDHAEKASSEKMRQLWGRVLAGEIRKPGSFSLVTLNFMSLVDAKTASLIQRLVPWVIDGRWVPLWCLDQGISFEDLVYLEEISFGSGAAGSLGVTLKPNDGKIGFRSGKKGLILQFDRNSIQVEVFSLSAVGRQVTELLQVSDGKFEIFSKKIIEKYKEITRIVEHELNDVNKNNVTIVSSKVLYEKEAN